MSESWYHGGRCYAYTRQEDFNYISELLECGSRTYLCGNEKPVTDPTVLGPFTNEGFRCTILAVVITSVGFHPSSARLTRHSQYR